MKIVVLGGAGDVGSRVVNEALMRDHDVSVVLRTKAKIDRLPSSATPYLADVANTDEIAAIMDGHDLAVSAVRPPDGQEEALVSLTQSVLDAAAIAQIRVLVTGGAASLKVSDESDATVLSTPGFLPESVIPIARACFAQYEGCLRETRADWTYISPPAALSPGKRTGQYRLGTDILIFDAEGRSQITMEDFAVALLDEAENPRHKAMRFAVAY